MNKYISRIVDSQLEFKLQTFGAVNVVGPKWCGKTTSSEQIAKSALKLQKDPNKSALIETAEINPTALLKGLKPRLIDEWQDAPSLWDAVRAYCDDNPGAGHFILTGSTSKKVKTYHTGTGRISTLRMYPMSLYESGESNGEVSLRSLFDGTERLDDGCHSDLTIENLIFAACRGGWPVGVLSANRSSQLAIPKDYVEQIYERDMFSVDDVKRNKKTMKNILKSYARNISTLAGKGNIISDVSAEGAITDKTLDDYINVLEELYIIQDMNAWCPSIRSKTSIRSGVKREFVDPSIAVAALGGSPEYYDTDLQAFGFIFECLCIRDLRVYSSSLGGDMSYYNDRYGLEADGVLHLNDGRYALIEFKLGGRGIDEGAKHLCQLEKLIDEHNAVSPVPLRKPDLKMVVTGTEYGYLRPDGVYVIPIGCLRP